MRTFTFYSYKGGTGRSLLLANTARYLALLGYRVVALDFDFEAPGGSQGEVLGTSKRSCLHRGPRDVGSRPHGSVLRPGSRVPPPTTNLLALYEAGAARVTLYDKMIDSCARLLGIERRALANVVFLHEAVHALCHLGQDLDGRTWADFALPSSRDPSFRPSALHETLAQFFSHRLLLKLGDVGLIRAFERLSDHQPSEYQTWGKMLDVPIEKVRRILLHARAGLDDTPWGRAEPET